MFLRHKIRKRDGKEHRYYSKSIDVLKDGAVASRTLSLFPEDRCEGLLPDDTIVRVKLSQV